MTVFISIINLKFCFRDLDFSKVYELFGKCLIQEVRCSWSCGPQTQINNLNFVVSYLLCFVHVWSCVAVKESLHEALQADSVNVEYTEAKSLQALAGWMVVCNHYIRHRAGAPDAAAADVGD